MKLEFRKLGINGEGIGYLDRKPVFCPGVFPGETAEVKITEDHERYAKAELVKLLKRSDDRISAPICPYLNRCGGCPLLQMKAPAQLAYKKQLLEEALWKYGKIRNKVVREVHPSPHSMHYRTSCKLPAGTIRGHLAAGMYEPGSNKFVAIGECAMHTRELDHVKNQILSYAEDAGIHAFENEHGLRYLVLRGIEGSFQCALITGRDTLPPQFIEQVSSIPGMRSVVQSVNDARKTHTIFGTASKVLAGDPYITVQMNGLALRLSAESFFQRNAEQASELYRMAVAKIDPCTTLLEAYCGVGAMSLAAHEKAEEIIGIDSVSQAIENAEANAKLNHIENVSFRCGDAAEELQKILVRKPVDTLLADPPRSGMEDRMLETLLTSGIRKIIYVSCNPATLGKNLGVLKQAYDVRTIIPYDMFPNTPHIESITVLEKRNPPRAERMH